MRTLSLVCCIVATAASFMPQTSMHLSKVQNSSPVSDISMIALTKPQRVNLKNREYNKKYKSEMRTRIKRVEEAVADGDYSVASQLLNKCFAIVDKNVKRGIVHRNTAARKKSQLHLKVKALESTASA